MKVLISTFGRRDLDVVIQAMRSLAYDRLVLIGERGIAELPAFLRLKRLEEMSGHTLGAYELDEESFLGMVDSISEILQKHLRAGKDHVTLNISGGTKLMGDAAMLAAFRHGIEAYNIGAQTTKLPVLTGVTAKDRFTSSQLQVIRTIESGALTLEELAEGMNTVSRQTIDRCVRELRRQSILSVRVEPGKVLISLSESGLEVLRAIEISGT